MFAGGLESDGEVVGVDERDEEDPGLGVGDDEDEDWSGLGVRSGEVNVDGSDVDGRLDELAIGIDEPADERLPGVGVGVSDGEVGI